MVLASDPYIWGTGRRKTSIARVRMKSGTGKFLVNGKPVDEYFTTEDTKRSAKRAIEATENNATYDIWARVVGGGVNGQADAVSLGVSRAMKMDNPETEHTLREHGLLTRDPRMVERKKYGLRKARRATQFSKR